MQLNELKREVANKSIKRVGRGGGRGKTAGRGTKGQNARAGHKKRPEIREQLKKLPKLRGYQHKSIQVKPLVVNVKALEQAFAQGDTIAPSALIERGLIRVRRGVAVMPPVKILGDGNVSKKFTITGCVVSSSAREKIEKAGGSVTK